MEKYFDYEIKNFIEEERKEEKKERELYLIDILEEINNNFNIDIIKYSNEKGYNYILLYLLDYNKNLYIEIDDFYRIRSYLSYNYGLTEQQATYFETFDNIEELKNYINRKATTTEQPKKQNKDRLFFNLYIIEENKKTKLENIKKTFGYREKEIFNNLLYATTNEKDNTITLYDKELNYFIINYKSNLIVG